MIHQFFNSPLPYTILTLLCLIAGILPWKTEENARLLRSMFVLAAVVNAFIAGVATP